MMMTTARTNAHGEPTAVEERAAQTGSECQHQLKALSCDDAGPVDLGVIEHAHGDAEAIAQRGGQQALAGGRADQRERRQVDPHAACRGALADDQVERAVLHRGVKHFLDDRMAPAFDVDAGRIG